MFKSKIEIREFAIEQAVAILGTGTPQKDIVSKAKEIEAYVLGNAELPETSEEESFITELIGKLSVALGINECNDIPAMGNEETLEIKQKNIPKKDK